MLEQIFNAQLIAEAFGNEGTLLILAGIGYLFTDRAGVFNIAIEGLLLFSAFFAAVGSAAFGSSLAGVLSGIAAALVVSALFFVVSIRMRADIIVVGIAINLLAGAVTVFLLSHLFGVEGNYQPSTLQALPSFSIPGLQALPLLGPTFSDENILTYLSWLAVPLASLLLYRTPLGLRLRAVGENPEAAQTVGINVQQMQFVALMLCAVLTGLAGSYLSIGPYPGFVRNGSAGQGWIALAAETLGNATPLGTFLAAVFFGAARGVSSNMQAANIAASQLADAIPYLVTIIGLALAARRVTVRRSSRRGGGAAGQPLAADAQAGTQPATGV